MPAWRVDVFLNREWNFGTRPCQLFVFNLLTSANDPLGRVSLKLSAYILRIVKV